MAALSDNADFGSENALLAALPHAQWERLRPHLAPILMTRGEALYRPGVRLERLYFPVTSVLSISCLLAEGSEDAVVLTGHEGFASIEVFLGSDAATRCAVVQSSGWAYQLSRESLQRACEHSRTLRNLLLRYTQSYMTQVAQTAACNRCHSIDQQLSRWLLMFLDRQDSSELSLTHQQLAALMGIRRESVSEAAARLQCGGSIHYHRGHIFVVDRARLESDACECYGTVKREWERLAQMSTRPDLCSIAHRRPAMTCRNY